MLSGGYGSVIGTILGSITFGMIQVGLVLAGAPGHFFSTLTGVIVVGAVILNTSVARRMARSKPLAGFRRGSAAADAGDRGGDWRPPTERTRASCRHCRAGAPRSRLMSDRAWPPDAAPIRRSRRPASTARAPRVIQPIPPDAVPVIEAVNISKAFGATTALVDVSLKAYAGRILALLGDNGAGKSTLIKILSGVFPPDRGELRIQR